MPDLGAHLSIAGGLEKAIAAAVALECTTVQIFTKNASQWNAKPLTDEQIRVFQRDLQAAKLRHVTAHDSYLINLASPGEELFQKSLEAFIIELERAEALGLSYLVTHPGSHVGSGEEAGLKRVIEGLNLATRRTAGFRVMILLENTAGQGSSLGYRLEHLAMLLKGVQHPERFGVCFDTCHAFAGGYDLRTRSEWEAVFEQFDQVIGLRHLKLFHLNDSVKGLDCRVDRHAGLGLGQIGEECFRWIVQDHRFAELPMILETPKENDDGEPMDPVNLGKLRAWLKPRK